MNGTTELAEQIQEQILKQTKELKTQLFEASGKILGRNWEDLTPKYKKYKTKKLGFPYPINIFTGNLLRSLLENALVVNVTYDDHLDKMNFKINIDSDKIGLKYADPVNNKREYISFSAEEKKIITEFIVQIIKEYFKEGQ